MKTTSLIIVAVSIGIIGAANAKPEGKREGRKLPPEVIARFDKDGDGKLNEEERAVAKAARQAVRANVLERFDTDNDGKLSKTERKAMKAAVLEKFDVDGDGKLSADERKEARKEFPVRPRRGGKDGAKRKGGPDGKRGDREAPGAGE